MEHDEKKKRKENRASESVAASVSKAGEGRMLRSKAAGDHEQAARRASRKNAEIMLKIIVWRARRQEGNTEEKEKRPREKGDSSRRGRREKLVSPLTLSSTTSTRLLLGEHRTTYPGEYEQKTVSRWSR